ncbi:MAG: hydrogenase maturation protease [Roseiarcus sp.]
MIAVIGCGNSNRCDDGVGPEVVRALRKRDFGAGIGRLRLIDAGTDGMAAMFAARGCATLIIVDACRSGAEAGAIFEVPGHELAQSYAPSLTLHDFRWDHALDAGRRIFREAFPADVVVLLVEAATVDYGLGLSPAAAAAAAMVVRRIETLIAARLQSEAAGS